MNIFIGLFILIIGVIIGFFVCAMLTQNKLADIQTITSHTYEHLMHEKCKNCKLKSGQ